MTSTKKQVPRYARVPSAEGARDLLLWEHL